MDEDFALALRLQEEFDRQLAEEAQTEEGGLSSGRSVTSADVNAVSNQMNTSMSLVDERWETLDPNPDARTLFLQFNERFFWGKLAGVEVRWSPRMTLCAGVCSYEGNGGLCSVRLSLPLLKLRPRKDLVETLLHEMIHAYLFVTANNRDRDGHGPEFHKHMNRINTETGTKISVYHSFSDEVDHHRNHWWRCDGPCLSRQPYFGYVKRSMNRAPHPRDTWWAAHQASCGGTFTKVKEPEDYGKKKPKESKSKESSPVKPKGVPDIRSMFGAAKDKKSSSADDGATSSASKSLMDNMDATQPKLPSFPGSGVTLGSSSSSKPSQPSSAVGVPPNRTAVESSSSDIIVLSPTSEDAFKGKGLAIGGASSDTMAKPNRVVRNIPGIGLITSERPVIASASTGRPSTHQGNSEERSKHGGTKRRMDDKASSESKRRKSEPAGGKRNSIGATGERRSLTLDTLLLGTSPGSSKKVPGFRSVSSKGATPPQFVRKDPAIVEEERLWLNKRGRFTPKGGLHILKKTNNAAASTSTATKPKQNTSIPKIDFSDNEDESHWMAKPPPKKPPPRDWAVNRNQRAINGSDSEDSNSDSDSDNRALVSAINNKLPDIESNGPYSWSRPNTGISPKSKTKEIQKPWLTGPTSNNRNAVNHPYSVATATASSSAEDVQRPWSASAGLMTNNVTTVAAAGGGTYGDTGGDLQQCPVCQTLVNAAMMNNHLDTCLNGGFP